MEFSLGTLILAVVGSGVAVHLLTQRVNTREALRTAYIDYLAAVELVGRAKIKCQSAITEMHRFTKALRELADNDPSIQEHRSDMKQHVVTARIEVQQTNVDLFDTRAVVASAKNRLRLLETDDEFDQKVHNLNKLLGDFVAPNSSDSTSMAVNRAVEALVLSVRTHHPRLAVHLWALRWQRFWGSIGKHTL